MTAEGGVQYSKIAEIKGPLVVVDDVENAAFDELVEIETTEGERRLGKVLEVGNGKAIVQVFDGTTGLSIFTNIFTPPFCNIYKITRVTVHPVN